MASLLMLNAEPLGPTDADAAATLAPALGTNETPAGPVTIARRRTHGPVRVPGFVAEAGIGYVDQNVGGQAAVLTETFQGPVVSGIAPQAPLLFRGSVPSTVILAAPSVRGNVGKSNDGGVAPRSRVNTGVVDNETMLSAFLNPAIRAVMGR